MQPALVWPVAPCLGFYLMLPSKKTPNVDKKQLTDAHIHDILLLTSLSIKLDIDSLSVSKNRQPSQYLFCIMITASLNKGAIYIYYSPFYVYFWS